MYEVLTNEMSNFVIFIDKIFYLSVQNRFQLRGHLTHADFFQSFVHVLLDLQNDVRHNTFEISENQLYRYLFVIMLSSGKFG